MASPQVENGHIDIANEIVEALARTNLSSYQSRILWALWRKTWGWHKKEDWIPLSQFEEMTGISKSHISRTITELKTRNMVTNSGNKIAFNKDYTQWRELPKGARGYQSGQQGLPIGATEVTNPGNEGYQSGLPQKKLLKRNSSKEISQKKEMRVRFEAFWTAYPKKKSKGQAEKAFFRTNPDEQLAAVMMAAIERAKTSEEWLKDGGQFIPYPATWLNARGWEDEPTELHPLAGQVSETGRRNIAVLESWSPPS
ncbi:MAG TPA: replication protein [Syntrophales bacterium]|nr:replication protein [Syntrophales bacterium]